jgi:hypothetical protein
MSWRKSRRGARETRGAHGAPAAATGVYLAGAAYPCVIETGSVPAAAEVGLHDALVLAQGGAVALDDDLSGLEHVAVVGQLERDFGVLLDQQDGGAQLVE